MLGNVKKYVYLFLTLSIFILMGTIAYWWYGVTHVSTQMGRLNINKIAEDNRLKIVQKNIDFLVDIGYPNNQGHYTAIVPFSVQSGFDVDQIEIIEAVNQNLKDSRTSGLFVPTAYAALSVPSKVIINLPEPRLLNSDISDDQKYMILRDDKSGGNFDLTKAYESFGRRFAEQKALENDILVETNAEAVKVLSSFARNIYPESTEIEVNTTPPSIETRSVHFKCPTMPIRFSVSENDAKEWNFQINNSDSGGLGYNGFHGALSNGSIKLTLSRNGKAKNLKNYMESWASKNYGRLFSPTEVS